MLTSKFQRDKIIRMEFHSSSTTDLYMVEEITQQSRSGCRVSFPPDPYLLHRIVTEVDDRMDFPLRNYYKQWLESMKLMQEIKEGQKAFPLSPQFPLRSYQVSSASFLLYAQRAILCDETGMGKTPAALAAAVKIGGKILIVTQSYLKYNMKTEILKWMPEMQDHIFLMDGVKKKREQTLYDFDAFTQKYPDKTAFLITNTESISVRTTRSENKINYPYIVDTIWDVVIADESHRYSKGATQRSLGIALLKSQYFFFLQGHLVNKGDPSKLFPLLKVIDPYRFPNYWQFCRKYCEIETGGYGKKVIGIHEERAEEWKEIMREYILQRFKEDYIEDMPEKIFKELYVPLDKKHRRLYEDFKKNAIKGAEGMPSSHKLGLITNLRKLLLNPEKLGFPAYHPSETVLLELLEDTPSAIIFGWYRETVYSISALLKTHKIPHVAITGDITDMQVRNQLADKFQSGQVPFLVGTMASCGQGLNLDVTSNVIFVEPEWDPANVQQAIDRAHRVTTAGRQTPLTITTLIIKDTIQEDMYNLCMKKRDDISRMELVDELINNLRR